MRGLHDALLDHIDDERAEQPFTDLEDFVRRTGATVDQVEALATAGAFEHCFGQSRRSALWAAGALGTARPSVRRDGTVIETLPGVVTGTDAPPLPGMTEMETVGAELWAMGLQRRQAPHRVRARRAGRARAWSPRAELASSPTAAWSRSRGW